MEGSRMSTINEVMKQIVKLGLLLMIGVSMSAEAGTLGLGGTSWKEEVLLHDGQKIIVKRSQSYGGNYEIGQTPPIKEQEITFIAPNTSKSISFKSEYGEDIGRANFTLLALHVLNGTPYVVAEPNLCLSYNKWGRPNPPYVIFKHDGKNWNRITLKELPSEFKEFNFLIETKGERETIRTQSIVTADLVKKLNGKLEQPAYKTILREPVKGGGITSCGNMVPYGKGGWLGLDWFRDQPTYEACLKFCERKDVSQQSCPCETLFKGAK
jgi:hypothetical protein